MKKLFLILVCLSVVGISGCGASAPKEVQIGPNTVKIFEVGKDIAPGTYVAKTDGAVYTNGKEEKQTAYIITTKDSWVVDEIKTEVANGKHHWPGRWSNIAATYINNNDKIVASEHRLIIVYSAGNTTLKQQ